MFFIDSEQSAKLNAPKPRTWCEARPRLSQTWWRNVSFMRSDLLLVRTHCEHLQPMGLEPDPVFLFTTSACLGLPLPKPTISCYVCVLTYVSLLLLTRQPFLLTVSSMKPTPPLFGSAPEHRVSECSPQRSHIYL